MPLIVKEYNQGESLEVLSKRYGMTMQNIINIVHGYMTRGVR
jgi:Mor family transcriptional regulator